ncbi:arrestin domain-containing protein 17-like [Ctenocephalides felis]|uniref:arrestin domain-containing protein 17-like n=1 Tax=Ctenocephalides felis TaxID=7515 RepID=UPI000E6E5695|nr:arrestin domain-containing protein 17-like [Ctenocephalides felis]XP_026466767.1 arrestin domain-containing protein 17-like [Ctenocephalides felis]XP_026467925.1 arrestin domain-containing protein 17-like [Ctenocephalides felis]
MGLKECQILLDNPWNTYYAGQTINGRVEITFDTPKKVRGIHIVFKGEAHTSWMESETKTDNQGQSQTEDTSLSGHEEYFQIQYYLLGGKNGGEIELPAGTHTYPFTCALPPSLPSSFEGEWGYVRYTVKVTLDRPWKFDQDTKMAFTVISAIDLNLDPRVKEPVKLELEKTFCCCWCKSGPLSVIVGIPVTGYVSGQEIPISAECDNNSNVAVTSLKFTLRKNVKFHTQMPRRATKEDSIVIAELQVGPIEPGKSANWNQKMTIPPLPPSNLVNCGIIDLDYDLKIETVVPGIHRGLKSKIPIILGTIPLASFQPNAPYTDVPVPQSNVAPAEPDTSNPNAGGWALPSGDPMGAPLDNLHALYPNIPAPTFAEGQFGATSIQDKNDTQYTRMQQQTFAPCYPTFAFNPSAPVM